MLLNNSTTNNLWRAFCLSPSKLTQVLVCGYNNFPPHPNFLHSVSLSNFNCSGNVMGPIAIDKEFCCRARRRIRYEDEEDDDGGYNEEIAMLEMYSQSARGEALLVTAMVDDQLVEVLIFKGFSSCLSYGTSPDPSKSVLPQRAIIKSIDRIRGPFNPTNIEYIEKGLTWEKFRSRLCSDQ
ncbi:Histidinol-phosphate aminotransferase [Bienertia sinuspersici]